ncbi:MAG: hypothetical protein ACYC8S_02195 [Minisyncoccota bacterium]
MPSKTFLAFFGGATVVVIGAGLFFVSQKNPEVFTRDTRQSTDWKDTLGTGKVPPTTATNLTQSAAQGLVTEYISAVKDNSGNSLSPSDQTQLAQTIAQKVAAESTSSPQYVKGDLKLVADSSGAYQAYGNALATLFASYTQQYPQNEVDAMRAGIQNKDRIELAKLSTTAVVYQKLATDIASLQVPLSLSDIDVNLLNGYTGLGKSLLDVQAVLDDSMRGFIGITEYEYSANQVVLATKSLSSFFAENHMVFSASEPGALFTTPTR